jgi:inorganic pyrophosphatase
VAQLGARFHGMEEVDGSNPSRSTKSRSKPKMKLSDIDPGPYAPKSVRMIVEIAKGGSNKCEYDIELGVFRLDRALYSPMHYPGDYGFVPGTVADDGDPIDILVLMTHPSFTGCMIEVRPVGILDMVDNSEAYYKLLAVPMRNPRYDEINNIGDVRGHQLREIEHFFQIYKELEGKNVKLQGWRDVHAAHEAIMRARGRYLDQQKTAT